MVADIASSGIYSKSTRSTTNIARDVNYTDLLTLFNTSTLAFCTSYLSLCVTYTTSKYRDGKGDKIGMPCRHSTVI